MTNTLTALKTKANALLRESQAAKEKARASITLTDKLELYTDYRRLRDLSNQAYRDYLRHRWESETMEPWPL